MNKESDYQGRTISFFLISQKSEKNCRKNNLKKLIFTALHPTDFESFFRKLKVIAFLFAKLFTVSEKIAHFRENAVLCPPVYHTRWKLHTAHFIANILQER